MPAPSGIPTITPEAAIDQGGTNVGLYRASQSADLAAKQRSLNGAKKPAFIPNAIKKQSLETQVYIFNVGPKPQEGSGASYGRVMIQPCLPGKEYSEPYVVPGIPFEQYQHQPGRLSADFHGDETDITEPGWNWACQSVGGFTDSKGHWEGRDLSKNNSLERFGVGISRQWPPAKEDVALAKKKMHAEYQLLVSAAREAHSMGQLSKLLAVNGEFYFIAAHALGLNPKTERWMEFSAAPEQPVERVMKACPACGEEILSVAIKCKHCGEFIDFQKAK